MGIFYCHVWSPKGMCFFLKSTCAMGILWIYEIMFSGLDSRVPCEHSCFHSWYFSLGIVTFLLQLRRHQWSLDQIWTIYVFDIESRETLQSSTSQCSISRAANIRAHLFCIPAFPSLYSLVPCIARVVATMKWCEHIYTYIHTHTYIYILGPATGTRRMPMPSSLTPSVPIVMGVWIMAGWAELWCGLPLNASAHISKS